MHTSVKIIGAHMSAAGGLDKAIERAAAIGCNAVQVFSGSPRVWKKPPLENLDLSSLVEAKKKHGVGKIFTHALYLTNLASDNPVLVDKTIDSLKYELRFDALVGGNGVIVHLGSHQGRGFESVQEQLVHSIDSILRDTPENSLLLIENAASRNGKIGGTLAEVAYLLDHAEAMGKWVSGGRLGWCLDTCHAHASGLALGSAQLRLIEDAQAGEQNLFKSNENTSNTVLSEILKYSLLPSLGCIHVNDSKDEFGSNRDRHTNLGDGLIPAEDMRFFLTRDELASIPLLLEVPGLENEGPDAENIRRLKAMISADPEVQ